MFHEIRRRVLEKSRSKSNMGSHIIEVKGISDLQRQLPRYCNRNCLNRDPKKKFNFYLLHSKNTIYSLHPLNNKQKANVSIQFLYQLCYTLSYRFSPPLETITVQGYKGDDIFILLQGEVDAKTNCIGLEILKDEPYAQTVMTCKRCEFAILSKFSYSRIKSTLNLKEINIQIDYLRQLPLFGNLGKRTLETLLQCFQVEFINSREVVYREGDEADYIYLVKEGELELQKQFRFKTKLKSVGVSRILENEIFGDLECLLEKPRQYTVKCLKNAICFKVSREMFYQKVITDNPSQEAITYINQYIRALTLNRNERLNTISDTIEENSRYLLGLEDTDFKPKTVDELKSIELRLLDKTHSRYAPIYNKQNKQTVKVRYATIHKYHAAIPRCTSKSAAQDRVISVSVLKSPERSRLAMLYDEIDVPITIKRKYQTKLETLQKQIISLSKQQYKIRTYNNASQIIAYND